MIRNFLLTTYRNFLKNILFVIINIVGIGIAMACCIVAFYNNKFHNDFDDFHRNKEIIFKVSITREMNNRQQPYGITPLSLGPAIGISISGIDEIVRITHSKMPVRYGDNIFNKRIVFSDTNYFDVFDLPMITGNPTSIKEESNILLSLEFASACFGDLDPVGEIIRVFNDSGVSRNYTVSGIFKDLPENSSMRFDALCGINNFIDIYNIDEHDWKAWVAATFFKIPDKRNVKAIESQLARYVPIQNDARDDWKISGFYTEPLKVIPTTGREIWANRLNSGLHPAALITPSVMAILLLLLACLNFTNTSLAISSRRLKEIGVRKVMGGIRSHTTIQFLGENLILVFFALLISLFIGYFLIDEYSNMWPGMTLKISFSEGIELWLFLAGLLFITGFAAGFYPAFYVSRFNAIKILKGDIRFSGGGLFSKILLVFQFILAISGIVSAVIFAQNARFQENLYLGYNKDQVIAVPIDNNSKLEMFRNSIMQNPSITNIGLSEEHIGWGSYMKALKWGEEKEIEVRGFDIGRGYFETMGIELKEGRYFDQNFKESERSKAIIVNEKFVEDFGWKNAIGQKLRENDTVELTVVGVMKNFYPFGVWVKIDPAMFKLGIKKQMRTLVVQADISNIVAVNDFMREEWNKTDPNSVYPGFFQNETLKEAKEINKQIKIIFMFLAVVSVLLSLVGLYTLVSLNIIKKTKEIGIRKVLGAPIGKILSLINRDFIIIIFIASIFGSALGYYLSEMLLGSIWEVYMETSIYSFLIPVVFILLVSIVTLSVKVYKAANKNPVDAIKYE